MDRVSLVIQGLRTHLPVEGIPVQSLFLEDPTCQGATKLVHHNYWASILEPVSHNYSAFVPPLLTPATLEPASHNYWAHVLQLPKHTHLEFVLPNERSHHNEKPGHCKRNRSSLQLKNAYMQQWSKNEN